MTEQEKRRRKADAITHLYRGDPEEEIEVALEVEFERADPSCGVAGGVSVGAVAVRIDNGEAIDLTPDEVEREEVDALERAAPDAEDYDDRDD